MEKSNPKRTDNPGVKDQPVVSSTEQILDDFRSGDLVILVDDENRENEGDLVVAAERVTPAHINFMASQGRGLICLTLTEERCRKLNLPLMVNQNNARYSTNFTVSIEAAEGVTTGISAADRATTVRAAVHPEAEAKDIVTPGHIFPVMAQPGGVLTRAGHTEAGVDLARLSGFEPASVICEILNPDGSMARLPDLLEFGRQHNVKIGTIADLIRYRLKAEPTVWRASESRMQTQYGEFRAVMYEDATMGSVHLALVTGAISPDVPIPVRVHAHRGPLDLLATARGRSFWSVDRALEHIAAEGAGILVLLEYREAPSELRRRLQVMASAMEGTGSIEAADDELRMIGAGSQILADLGAGQVLVLGTPRRTHALSGFGLEVIDYLSQPGMS